MSKLSNSTIKVITKNQQTYPIIIGSGLDNKLIHILNQQTSPGRLVIITDSRLAPSQGKDLLKKLKANNFLAELLVFPAGEKNKTQNWATKLQHTLLKKHYGRDTTIIALGGGVVGDLAGFVAATFLRGVKFIQIPTTILAMVDASVGGKVGVDTKYGKNTVGAFHQPQAVVIDLARAANLPPLQVINGLMEAIKTFVTYDAKFLKSVEKIKVDNIIKNLGVLTKVIKRSVKIKASVVMRDEKEQNERRVINFGHTIGHALELLSRYKLPHGIAVGYGMLAEAKISESLGILSAQDCLYLFNYLERFGVTTKIFNQYSAKAIMDAVSNDKKIKNNIPHYILLKKIGAVYTKNGQFALPVKDSVIIKVLNELGSK